MKSLMPGGWAPTSGSFAWVMMHCCEFVTWSGSYPALQFQIIRWSFPTIVNSVKVWDLYHRSPVLWSGALTTWATGAPITTWPQIPLSFILPKTLWLETNPSLCTTVSLVRCSYHLSYWGTHHNSATNPSLFHSSQDSLIGNKSQLVRNCFSGQLLLPLELLGHPSQLSHKSLSLSFFPRLSDWKQIPACAQLFLLIFIIYMLVEWPPVWCSG